MTYKSDENRNDIGESKISFHAWKTLAILSGIATMVLYAETMVLYAETMLVRIRKSRHSFEYFYI
jgi:hypothetical protein